MNTLAHGQASSTQPQLSPRQRQILELLRVGKVNKEIARELGIGVGTVKQHVVALFKRLNVRNRAMAVSRGMDMLHGMDEAAATLAADGLLERRPCVVLSIALPEEADIPTVRRLHETLASLAFDNDALFLARKGNAGDVIFGVQRVTEYDVAKALSIAHAVFNDLSVLDSGLVGNLRGGLTAGLALVSMKRYGGWSGEAIASAAIFSARELSQQAAPGQLAFGQPAQDLMQAFGMGDGKGIPLALPFPQLENMRWTGERVAFPLIGRSTEYGLLEAALKQVESGSGRVIYLEGETGMGKSRLCREILESCMRIGGSAWFFRSQPLASGELLGNVLEGGLSPVADVAKMLHLPSSQIPELVIVDDFHLLAKEKQYLLTAAAVNAGAKGRLVIFSGRRNADLGSIQAELVQLRRLPADAIEKLVHEVVKKRTAKVRASAIETISRLAAGVPLFAVELAKHYGTNMLALPLLVVVCARLDGLQLDRKVLRAVAHKQNSTPAEVATILANDVAVVSPAVEHAVLAGVLAKGADDRLSFTHPLLRQVIDYLSME